MATEQPEHHLIFDVSKFNNAPMPVADLQRYDCPALCVRITQGGDEVDARAAENVAAARAAGIPVIAYHALLPGDAPFQAQFFAAQCRHLDLLPGVAGHVVDWEITGGDALGFATELRRALPGVKVGVYASPAFYAEHGPTEGFPFDYAWVAQWLTDPRAGDPAVVLTSGGQDGQGVTPGWWTAFAGCEHYLMRQFTSSGDLPGLAPVDCSVTYETVADFRSALGITDAPAPTPPPAPPAPTKEITVHPPEIREGASGDAVKIAQGLLLAHGFGPHGLCNASGVPDGVFGPATDVIVRDFQAQAQIAKDGIVGPDTWAHLLAQIT